MSERTTADARVEPTANATSDLGWAVLAGVTAGVAFGLLLQFVLHRMTVIGALYTLGDANLLVGWVAHLIHSAIFGLLFGVLAWWRPVDDRTRTLPGATLAAAGYGTVLWLVNIVVVWPLWLNAVGVEMLPFPYLAVRPLAGHLLWGLLLGALYWGLTER